MYGVDGKTNTLFIFINVQLKNVKCVFVTHSQECFSSVTGEKSSCNVIVLFFFPWPLVLLFAPCVLECFPVHCLMIHAGGSFGVFFPA